MNINITIPKIKKDLTKIAGKYNVAIRFDERQITNLLYKKYVARVMQYNDVHISQCLPNDKKEYEKFLSFFEDKVAMTMNRGKYAPDILNIIVAGRNTKEEIEQLCKNKDISEKTMPSLGTIIKKRKPPVGSLKNRVKIRYRGHADEGSDFMEQLENMFGTDKNAEMYVNIPSKDYYISMHRGVNSYKRTFAFYVNFKNEDDIILLSPFQNYSGITHMNLEIYSDA